MLRTLAGVVGHRWNQNRTDSLVAYTATRTKVSWQTTGRTQSTLPISTGTFWLQVGML